MDKNRLTVSGLNSYIKGVFDDELILKNITVIGEVYEKSLSGGHLFFTLKDEQSILRCVRFGGGFTPEIGDTVAVFGSVEYYAKGNRLTFQARSITPVGEGAIKREFNAMVERLKAEGLFDNRPPLPVFIKKVGIITSETGAVIHDFISVIYKAHTYIDVDLYSVKVQGEGAEKEIANAVVSVNANANYDLIVIARGGGANTDLDAFNTELVARAVSSSKIPVMSAIGHQIDYTLCDLCASERAGTPSIAGEKVCRINENFIGRIYESAQKLSLLMTRNYSKVASKAYLLTNKLTDFATNTLFKSKNKISALANKMQVAMEKLFAENRERVIEDYSKLMSAEEKVYNDKERAFTKTTAILNAVNPLKLIKSGYAKVYYGRKSLESVKQIKVGDEIEVLVSDGIIEAKTVKVKNTGSEV